MHTTEHVTEQTTEYVTEVTVLIVSGCDRELSTYHSFLQSDRRSSRYTIEAKSALEATQICDFTLLDCILLDFELPDAGLVLDLADRVPVVVLLEREDKESIDRSIALGAQDYLIKPNLTPELLCRTVHNSIERARLRQQLAETNSIAQVNTEELRLCTLSEALVQEQLRQHLAQAEDRIKHQELELFNSEHKFRNIFKTASIGMCLASLKGEFLEANSAICQMLGYSKQELVGMAFAQITYAEDLELNIDYLRRTLAGEISCYQMEKRYIHKNGQLIWGLLDVSLVRDSAQQPLYLIAQVQDISDRKRVSAELQEQTALLNTVIEAIPDAIYLKDGLGRWLVVNQAGLDLFELGGIDYRGKTDTELAEFNEFYREALLYCQETDITTWQKGSTSTAEEIVPQRDGSQKIFDGWKVPLFNTDGSRKGLVVVGRDITDRKKREDILHNIALGVSAKVGDDFFQSLVQYLCHALSVEFAFVAQIGQSDDRYMQVVAGYGDGAVLDTFDYDKRGTACENVVGKQMFVCPNDAQRLFPSAKILVDLEIEGYVGIPLFSSEGKAQGAIAIMSRRPLHDTKLIEEVLTIFAARVSSELERQQTDAKLRRQEQRSRLFAEVTVKIRESTELKEILQTTVTEIQKILHTDRVVIYQINPDGSGKIVEESVVTGVMALLGRHDILDPCLTNYIKKYPQGHVSSIADIEHGEIQPCHAAFLKQFDVKANLVVPILFTEHLWGLMIAHQCDRPRQWTDFETELLTQLSNQVSIALSRSQMIEDLRRQEQRSRLFAEVTVKIRESTELKEILQITVGEIQKILHTDRVVIYQINPDGSGKIVEESVVPGCMALIGKDDIYDPCFVGYFDRYAQGRISSIADIDNSDIQPCHAAFLRQFDVKANLVVPILFTEHLWGLMIAHQCDRPRQWTDFETGLLTQLSDQVSIAISSSQQLENLRHSRELLFQKARREEALNRVVLAIRNSLDLDTIFATATVETAQILDVQQVVIVKYFPEHQKWVHLAEYQHNHEIPDSVGFEISDLDNPLTQQLKQLQIVIINDTTKIEDDINKEIAQTFPNSWLMVPLSHDGSVWGSLSMLSDRPSTGWQDEDIELAKKIAAQLEIAIQQANLFEQSQIEIVDRKRAEQNLQELNQQLELRVKRRTEALKYSKQILQLTIQSTPIGICTFDLEGRYLTVNHAICQIFGYSAEEMLHKVSKYDLIHPDFIEQSRLDYDRLIAGEVASIQAEKQYIHQSGRVIDAISRVSLVRDLNGNPLHFVGGVEDITDRKRTDEKLRSSLLEKEILLKEIHHRVKNNLQLVSSLLHLQEGTIQDPKILEPFRDSQQRVKAMALIHEHLYQSDNLANINFTKYVQSLATSLFHSYISTSSHIELRVEIAEVKLEVNVAVPCGLIINELVSNAIKYAFPNNLQGEICISFTVENVDRYTLVVKDNGVGVPADLDIHNTASLGLQIVCALTDQLEGSFALDPKDGTTFKITFPKS